MKKPSIDHSPFFSILPLLVGMFIIVTVLQPFLPRILQTAVIALRLAVVPGCIVLFMLTARERFYLLGIVLCWVFFDLLTGTEFNREMIVILVSMLASLPYFKAGIMFGTSERARPIWNVIMLSILALNILTIMIFTADTFMGTSIAANASSQFQRDDSLVESTFRFAIGNAIEIPALLAIGTATSSIVLRSTRPLISYALVVNCLTSIISQSRMVLVISCYSLLRILWCSSLAVKFIITLLVVSVLYQIIDSTAIIELSESLIGRYLGNDMGSAKDRMDILSSVIDHCSFVGLTFGNGTGASLKMMDAAGFGYRTIECAALQMLYEVGLFRVALLVLFFRYTMRNSGVHFHISVTVLFVTAQVFLLLPVLSLTPFYVFFVAVMCVQLRLQEVTPVDI